MAEESERKPYTKPEIIYEMDLEIRAGTPLGVSPNGGSPGDPLNPTTP